MTPIDRDRAGETTDVGDAMAERARDVASIGLVVFPVLPNLYSVALLLRLRLSGLGVGYKGRKAAREAWRLDLAILGAAAVCLAVIAAAFLVRW